MLPVRIKTLEEIGKQNYYDFFGCLEDAEIYKGYLGKRYTNYLLDSEGDCYINDTGDYCDFVVIKGWYEFIDSPITNVLYKE